MKKQQHNFHGKVNILHFEKLAEHQHYFMKLDNSVQFGRTSSRKFITQVMIEFVSNNKIPRQQ